MEANVTFVNVYIMNTMRIEGNGHHELVTFSLRMPVHSLSFNEITTLRIDRMNFGYSFKENTSLHQYFPLTWHWGNGPSGCFTFQPSSGGMQINPDRIHTAVIMTAARAGVRCFRYSIAFVMLQYRSKEIRHRFIIEAVLKSTSIAEWISHHQLPNTQ